jgi:hypothetical protein
MATVPLILERAFQAPTPMSNATSTPAAPPRGRAVRSRAVAAALGPVSLFITHHFLSLQRGRLVDTAQVYRPPRRRCGAMLMTLPAR